MLSKTSSGFISDMRVTDCRHYNHDIENKIVNLPLQECSLKNRSFWKLVISLKRYMKQRYYFQDYVTSRT